MYSGRIGGPGWKISTVCPMALAFLAILWWPKFEVVSSVQRGHGLVRVWNPPGSKGKFHDY